MKVLASVLLVIIVNIVNCKFLNHYDLFYLLGNNTLPTTEKFAKSNFIQKDISHALAVAACIFQDGSSKCVFNGKTSYRGYYDDNFDVNEKTAFGLASITKIYNTAALLRIMQERPESFPDKLDTPISYFYENLKEHFSTSQFIENLKDRSFYESITLRNLLQHASGLGDFHFSKNRSVDWHQTTEEEYMTNEAANSAGYGNFEYTNIGSNLIGMVLRSLTNMTYSKILKKYILYPLDLQHTFTNEDLVNRKDRIDFKTPRSDGITLQQSYSYFIGNNFTGRDGFYFEKHFKFDVAAAGLYATLADTQKFLYNFLRDDSDEFLNEDSRKLRDLEHIVCPDEDTEYYGIGTMDRENGDRGHFGLEYTFNIFNFYNKTTNTSYLGAIASEGLTATLTKLLLPKEENEDVQGYYERRFELVQKLRKYFDVNDLIYIHNLMDRNSDATQILRIFSKVFLNFLKSNTTQWL